MPKIITVLRILVASPSDLDEERLLLDGVIQELNLTWLPQMRISFELIKWETYAFPGAGTDPQDVINHQLPADYDILLVMFWSRIGTPTPRYPSGTLEEFETAFQRWQQDPQSIRLMVYFKTTPLSPGLIDPDQLKSVIEFRNSLSGRGVLYYQFSDGEVFSRLLRVHLIKQAQDFLKVSDEARTPTTLPVAIITSPESLKDNLMEDSDDEGFLDLIEKNVNASQRAKEVMEHITEALKQLTSGTQQSTLEMKSVKGDEKAKFAAYKRISNRQADNMADFVARMQPEIPILHDSLFQALDSYERTMMLLTDFGSSAENHTQLEDALSAAVTLKLAMVESEGGIENFRLSILGLPRITIQFNRAKRNLLSLLDNLLVTYDQGINLLGEIEATGKSILDTWHLKAAPSMDDMGE